MNKPRMAAKKRIGQNWDGLALCVFVIGMGLSACMQTKKPDKNDGIVVTDFSSSYILPNSQVRDLTERSENGDGEASYRLYVHYGMGTRDAANAEKFFNRAVNLEYPLALYTKAVLLWNSGHADAKLVLRYLKRAIELGQPDTGKLLPLVEAKAYDESKP